MSTHDIYLRQAFAGGDLHGTNLVKLVYFDESGTGMLERDPDLVVAGIMIDGDKHYVALRAYLHDMLEDFTPKGARRPKYLHAKDIYHGTGDFSGDEWKKVRLNLLAELAKVPDVFDAPIFGAAVDRAGAAADHDLIDKYRDLNCYTIAAGCCILQVERYMRRQASEMEVAQLTFEDAGKLKTRVRSTYQFLQKPDAEFLEESHLMECVPVSRIMDAPTYQEKADSSILQVADYCAFAIKRYLRRQADWKPLFEPLVPNIIDLSYAYGEANPHTIVTPNCA